ncbi:uncharacterized protein LOC127286093 [Leptopilina boulardi]|uniref:uncharacterized protein LOC127286093 n=1 Tax=Leptopilina boulardi TaxID=63433 RepID=UPI0021F50C51|nr:uncharacterized protein LOC127286093 [Leptopilina boulardi]
MQVVIENDTEIYQLPFGNSIEKFFDIDKFEKAINEDRELLDEILGEKSEDVEQTFKNKKLEETSEPLISKPPLQEQSEKLHDPTADSPIQCPPFKDQSKELNDLLAIPPIPNLPLHGQSTCNSNILDGPADSHILTSPRNVQWDRRNNRLGHTYMSYSQNYAHPFHLNRPFQEQPRRQNDRLTHPYMAYQQHYSQPFYTNQQFQEQSQRPNPQEYAQYFFLNQPYQGHSTRINIIRWKLSTTEKLAQYWPAVPK